MERSAEDAGLGAATVTVVGKARVVAETVATGTRVVTGAGVTGAEAKMETVETARATGTGEAPAKEGKVRREEP